MSNGKQNWRIAGQSGNSYLIHTSGDPGTPEMKGRVLDLDQGILFREFAFDSILARGYWSDYTGEQSALADLLAQVAEEPEVVRRA